MPSGSWSACWRANLLPVMTDRASDWLTTGQAARALAVSESRVRAMADEGVLEAEKTPLGRLFSAASVERVRKLRANA